MELSERSIQILLGGMSVVISTAVSLFLGQWFNRRQIKGDNTRADRRTEADEFAEHRQAFQFRIKQLEDRCSELEQTVDALEAELERVTREGMISMRTNFELQRQLDICREQGDHHHRNAG